MFLTSYRNVNNVIKPSLNILTVSHVVYDISAGVGPLPSVPSEP